MIYSSHGFLLFFPGKCSDDPENVDWAPSVFNYARAAPKTKLVIKDQSCKRYEKLCEKRDKSMKKNYQQRRKMFSLQSTSYPRIIQILIL